jgi:hypothetical protein
MSELNAFHSMNKIFLLNGLKTDDRKNYLKNFISNFIPISFIYEIILTIIINIYIYSDLLSIAWFIKLCFTFISHTIYLTKHKKLFKLINQINCYKEEKNIKKIVINLISSHRNALPCKSRKPRNFISLFNNYYLI